MNWQTATSLVTAATAAGALIFTGLSLSATRDQVALAEQGQVTDRYTKAVEQLSKSGAEHLHSRIGAIYALERLAGDSHRDQPTVINLLSAFVRTATPPVQPHYQPAARTCGTATPADVQAALTVLGRRDPSFDSGARIDLRGSCLPEADLTGAKFADADLTGASLAGAELKNADFKNARLHYTDLNTASLLHTDLTAASLEMTRLTDTWAVGVNLSGARVTNSDATGAMMPGADLTGTDLTMSKLVATNIVNARHDDRTVLEGVIVSEFTLGVWWVG